MSARKLSRFVGLVFLLAAIIGVAGTSQAGTEGALATEVGTTTIEWG